MSHWTTVKTTLNDQALIKKALKRMGLNAQEGEFKITQYGTTENAQLKLDDAVGIARQKDGTFAMVGDFWHSTNKKLKSYYGNNEQFGKDLSTSYAIEDAFSDLEGQSFFCTDNEKAEIGEDGFITMTFENYS